METIQTAQDVKNLLADDAFWKIVRNPSLDKHKDLMGSEFQTICIYAVAIAENPKASDFVKAGALDSVREALELVQDTFGILV